MTYPQIISLVAINLTNYFDKIYHSVEIVSNENEKFPAIPIADEWISLVPSDQNETVYIRRNGDDQLYGEEIIGSCVKTYKMQSSLRLVYFKDNANNHDEIIFKLMQSILLRSTKIKSIIRDKWKLLKDESNGDYNFGATTAYFAIDFYAYWILKPDLCEQDFCMTIENPFLTSK